MQRPAKNTPNPDSDEYKLGPAISSQTRDCVNRTLGDLLGLVEALYGDTQQAEAIKYMVKNHMWRLADNIKEIAYRESGLYEEFIPSPPPVGANFLSE